MANETPIKITTASGKEYLSKATEVISRNFTEDPAIKYMLCDLSESERLAYLPTYIHSLLKASALNEGAFQEANDWLCAAVWMPPGKRIDNPWTFIPAGMIGMFFKLGIKGCKKMLFEFEAQANAIKRKHLRDAKGEPIKEYYYLWFIATDRPGRGKGLASKVVSKWQDKAASEGQAVWLEATTAKSRDVYARCGFKAVGEISLGKGTHAANGAYEKGGPGVTVSAMLWRPDFRDGKEGEQSGSNGGSLQSSSRAENV